MNQMSNFDFEVNTQYVKKQTIYPIAELISTEVDYLLQLHHVVNGYMREYRDEHSKITRPRNLRNGEGLFVFANIETIFNWHRDYFLKSLVVNQHNPGKLAEVFINNAAKFQMYAVYSKNKTLSKYLVKKHLKYFEKVQNKLGHKSDLNHLLIGPIRRLANYKLLLTEIIKHVKKSGLFDELPRLYEAENIIKTVCTNVNDHAVLEGIQDILPNHGQLLHHGFLTCDYKKKTQCLLYVFVFKKFIVFTHRSEVANPYENHTYTIFLRIPMNKIEMYELSDKKFFLCSSYNNCEDYNIVCGVDDTESMEKWLEVIRNQLLLQLKFTTSIVQALDSDELITSDEKPKEVLI